MRLHREDKLGVERYQELVPVIVDAVSDGNRIRIRTRRDNWCQDLECLQDRLPVAIVVNRVVLGCQSANLVLVEVVDSLVRPFGDRHAKRVVLGLGAADIDATHAVAMDENQGDLPCWQGLELLVPVVALHRRRELARLRRVFRSLVVGGNRPVDGLNNLSLNRHRGRRIIHVNLLQIIQHLKVNNFIVCLIHGLLVRLCCWVSWFLLILCGIWGVELGLTRLFGRSFSCC